MSLRDLMFVMKWWILEIHAKLVLKSCFYKEKCVIPDSEVTLLLVDANLDTPVRAIWFEGNASWRAC